MVSRMFNSFPSLNTKDGRPFPKLKAGIMIGGGSMHCYENSPTKQPPPKNFLPCNPDINSNSPAVDSHTSVNDLLKRLGCCPRDQTEDAYDNGSIPWSAHPATLLLQSHDDDQATTGASEHYFSIMKARVFLLKITMYGVLLACGLSRPCETNAAKAHDATAVKIVAAGIVHGIVESQVRPRAGQRGL